MITTAQLSEIVLACFAQGIPAEDVADMIRASHKHVEG